MTLLGEFSLWIAFLLGSGRRSSPSPAAGRTGPSSRASVTNASYGIFGAPAGRLDFAVEGADQPRLQHRVRRRLHLQKSSRRLHLLRVLGRPEGLAAVLGGGAVAVRRVAQLLTPRRYAPPHALRGGRDLGGHHLLRLRHALRRQPVRAAGRSRRRTDAASIRSSRMSGMMIHPPMLYLGYISITIPFAFAVAALLSRAARHRLDPRHPEVDAGELAVPVDRHHAGDVVGLRRAGLGRLLGLGPGGEREPAPLAHDDGVPPLGDDPGKAGDAEALERRPDHRHVPAEHLRDVHHPLRGDRQRAQLHPDRTWATSSSASWWWPASCRSPCCTPGGRCSRPTCSSSRC